MRLSSVSQAARVHNPIAPFMSYVKTNVMLLVFLFIIWMGALANGTKMCVLPPMKWIDAMKHCQSFGGNPTSNVYIPKTVVRYLSVSSFWTSDYAALKPTIGNASPYWCEYITIGANEQIGGVQIGNCTTERKYFCCEHGRIDISCLKTGLWTHKKSCKDLHMYSDFHNLTRGDYWLNSAYSVANFTFSATNNTDLNWSLPTVSRCGLLDVNGDFQFVNDCNMKHYSVCVINDYPAGGIADCIQTKTTSAPYHVVSTADEQTTVEQNVSDPRDLRLAIGLGVGLSLSGLVFIVGIPVYVRRNSQSRDAKSGRVHSHPEIYATYSSDTPVVSGEVLKCEGETEDHVDPYCTIQDGIRDTICDLNHDVSSSYDTHMHNYAIGNTHCIGGHTQLGIHDHMTSSSTVMNTVYFTSTDTGEDPDYYNTDVMSDEYESIHFSAASDPIMFK